jgi:hypothetical protein
MVLTSARRTIARRWVVGVGGLELGLLDLATVGYRAAHLVGRVDAVVDVDDRVVGEQAAERRVRQPQVQHRPHLEAQLRVRAAGDRDHLG